MKDRKTKQQTVEELQQTAETFVSLSENANDGIIVAAGEAILVYANRRAAEMTGYSIPELLQSTLKDIIHPDESEKMLQRYRDRLAGKPVPPQYNTVLLRKDKVSAPVELTAAKTVWRGQPADVSIIRDITERKRAVELEITSFYTRSLIEASLDPLMTIGTDGKITDVNKATEEVTGVSRQHLIGSDFSNYFIEPEKAREGYKRVFSDGSVRDYPLSVRHVSARTTDVLYNASIYRNEAGEVQGVFAAARDVTRQNRAEAQLRAASLYTRSLIEAGLDPLVTISPEGKITDVNEATEQATGIPREHLIGSDFSDYFTEPEKARAGYQQVLSKGRVRDYPLTLRHTSGNTIDVLYNASVYKNESGEVQGVFAAARDITERKKLEEDLLRSNADLQQFAYVASHDLQEPLRMVSSYLQLIEQRYKDKLDAAGTDFMGYAVDGANRMQMMIQDLLTFSRVESRGAPFQPVNCEAVLARTLANLHTAIEENQAIVTHDPLPMVMADDTQMVQIFQNLIGNAIKFRRQELPQVHVSAQAKGKEWEFSVRDNGIGIDPQYAERIFVIFQRLHSKEEYPGTGIGLAVCKRVVERHGGKIWVESQPGQGATFYFTIPKKGGK